MPPADLSDQGHKNSEQLTLFHFGTRAETDIFFALSLIMLDTRNNNVDLVDEIYVPVARITLKSHIVQLKFKIAYILKMSTKM